MDRQELLVTTSRSSRDDVAPIQQSDALLPDELLEASHRMAANRARSARTLTRTRAQRRILPSIVVTSVALVGAGLANATEVTTMDGRIRRCARVRVNVRALRARFAAIR